MSLLNDFIASVAAKKLCKAVVGEEEANVVDFEVVVPAKLSKEDLKTAERLGQEISSKRVTFSYHGYQSEKQTASMKKAFDQATQKGLLKRLGKYENVLAAKPAKKILGKLLSNVGLFAEITMDAEYLDKKKKVIKTEAVEDVKTPRQFKRLIGNPKK